ncbi:MAG: SCO family protein [Pseudomonadota bacterium]
MRALFVALCSLILVACAPEGVQFKNTDITGSEVGRDFQLTDHTGRVRTLADFRGKVVAVFFGFTRCPDVCPTALMDMKGVRERLGEDAGRFQVLFITVDPARDTPQLLSEYVTAFDPTFLGLYGDDEAIRRTAEAFKVYYQKVPGSSADNYSMDHTAATYIYDPQGRLRLYVRAGAGIDAVVHDVKLLLAGR